MATLSDPATFAASASERTNLVGVVIAVPPPHRELLRRMRSQYDRSPGPSTPPHVTLLPPTELTEAERAQLPGHLAEVAARHPSFEVELAGMATFRPVSPVVYARVQDGASRCTALQEDVRSGPLAVQVRFDYHPHVTVAHNLPDAVLDRAMRRYGAFHARFPIRSFECFEWVDNDWKLQSVYPLSELGINRR